MMKNSPYPKLFRYLCERACLECPFHERKSSVMRGLSVGVDEIRALLFPLIEGDRWLVREFESSQQKMKEMAEKTVEQSLREDWESLGQDLWRSIEAFSANHGQEPRKETDPQAKS